MEFLVEFVVDVPADVPAVDVREREDAEAGAAAKLVADGHLIRLWRPPAPGGETRILGLYAAGDEAELRSLLEALPLYAWMGVTITPLAPHPNDPAPLAPHPNDPAAGGTGRLPDPRLRLVYRLTAGVGEPIELGEMPDGRRRIVPLTGGSFEGPELAGELLAAGSADWQTIRADGAAIGEIRYTLRTAAGAVLHVRAASIRHGPPEVLARLARGEPVSPSQYTFRTSTTIQTSAAELGWLNDGVFVAVGGREPAGVAYDVYLVE